MRAPRCRSAGSRRSGWRAVRLSCWLVVRVGAVGVDADVGAVLPDEAGALHAIARCSHSTIAYSLSASAGADAARRSPASLVEDRVDLAWATKWLLLCSAVRTASNWLTRSAELTICLADAAEEFDRAGIHHGDVHDGVVGEYCMAMRFDRRTWPRGQRRAPASLNTDLWSREAGRVALLDAVHRACAVRRWRGCSSTSGG